MALVGRFVQTFAEANMALAVRVPLNGDYHTAFTIKSQTRTELTLVSLKTGEEWIKRIIRRKGNEWFTYEHTGLWVKMFGGRTEKVTVLPFLKDGK